MNNITVQPAISTPPQFTLDSEAIFNVITSLPISPILVEEASALVDHWVMECCELDLQQETLMVEVPFFVPLDYRCPLGCVTLSPYKVQPCCHNHRELERKPRTYIVGVQDRIVRDEKGIIGNEWKTSAAESRWWNAEKWVESMEDGHQVSTYGLALREGYFVEEYSESGVCHCGEAMETHSISSGHSAVDNPQVEVTKLTVSAPRILTRAISKSYPPELWPDVNGVEFAISEARLNATRACYLAAAEEIRGLRRSGVYPWQHTGRHCTRFNKYQCSEWKVCHKFQAPANPETLPEVLFDPSDPAMAAVRYLQGMGADFSNPDTMGVDFSNPDIVVLSQSQLDKLMNCSEEYRVNSYRLGKKETSDAMDVGTVLHAGVAEMYRQHKAYWRELRRVEDAGEIGEKGEVKSS